MKRVDLKLREHAMKIGDACPAFEPNVTEDSLLYVDGKPVGFYLKSILEHSSRMSALADLANQELRSDRVPKSAMTRVRLDDRSKSVVQYSCIIGSIPARPHMRRNYHSRSSVHNVLTANNFVKAMLALCFEGEEIYNKLLPEAFESQLKIINESVPEKWRFGRLFTSSISNYNISAPFHRDKGNLIGCSNIIITKRKDCTGGNLHIPDYGATIDSADNSMLVYPAWRNVHGVTPIEPTAKGGYRNSLVFYPLKAFSK